MAILEKSVAAAAVVVLGLVASLNVIDDASLSRITTHPLYQEWVGSSSSAPATAPASSSPPSSEESAVAVVKDAVVSFVRDIDVEEIKEKGERWFHRGKAFLLEHYEKLTDKSNSSSSGKG